MCQTPAYTCQSVTIAEMSAVTTHTAPREHRQFRLTHEGQCADSRRSRIATVSGARLVAVTRDVRRRPLRTARWALRDRRRDDEEEKPPTSEGFSPVDLAGFEPATSSMRTRRAPNCATGPWLEKVYHLLRRATTIPRVAKTTPASPMCHHGRCARSSSSSCIASTAVSLSCSAATSDSSASRATDSSSSRAGSCARLRSRPRMVRPPC